jgi:hypothetical protein
MLLDIPEDKEVQWNEELFEKNGKPHNAYEKERFSSKESCHTQLVKPLEVCIIIYCFIYIFSIKHFTTSTNLNNHKCDFRCSYE